MDTELLKTTDESQAARDDKVDIPDGVFTHRYVPMNGVRLHVSRRAINATLLQLVVAYPLLIRNSHSLSGGHGDKSGHFRH